MKHGSLVFLAAFAAMAASWFGQVLTPQLQIGSQVQVTNSANVAELYPQARPGLAQQGQEVYRANGCAACHTRQVSQTGTVIDVVLTEAGTNLAAVAEALTQIRAAGASQAGVVGGLPKAVLHDATPTAAKAAALALRKAGARAEVRILPVGPDISRGWGLRQSVARDYLFDAPPLLGSLRVGPDLSNVGARLPDANWHLRHLYSPQAMVKGSIMPRYRFLFEERTLKPGQTPSPEAIPLTAAGTFFDASKDTGAADREMVPTLEARALVAYLLSLKTDGVLYETPMTVARAATAILTNTPGK